MVRLNARRVRRRTRRAAAPQSNNKGMGRKSRPARKARAMRSPSAQMSQAGLDFLKCAFAPPDFNTDPGKGIPDKFQGKVLMKKDVLTESMSFEANTDTWIIVAPTPGVAYWSNTTTIGAALGHAVRANPFPGFGTLFGQNGKVNDANDIVTAFRYAGMSAGLYPTSNLMQFGGSIQVWKVPLTLSKAFSDSPVQLTPIIQGLENTQLTPIENYSNSFIQGMYSQTICNDPDFEFNPIEAYEAVATNFPVVNFPALLPANDSLSFFTGLGDMDTIIIKVTTPVGAVNTAVLKIWACVEFRPNPQSMLYQYATDSPAFDELALVKYRQIAKSLPLAVPAAQNSGFWDRVKKILNATLSAATFVPGPIGNIATGVRGISDWMSALFL